MKPLKTYCTVCDKAFRFSKKYHKERHVKTPIHIKNSILYYQNENKKNEISNKTLYKQVKKSEEQVCEYVQISFTKYTKKMFKEFCSSLPKQR